MRLAFTRAPSFGAILSVGALFALITAACQRTEEASDSERTSRVSETGAVEMRRLPASARSVCHVLPLISRVCPRAVPEAPYATATAPPDFPGPSGGGAIAVCLDTLMRGTSPTSDRCENEILSIEAGHPTGPGPAGSKPPSYVHLLVYASRRSLTRSPSMFPFAWPHGPPSPASRGLVARRRTGPVFLGTRDWGGRAGDLVLAPRIPLGGEMGNHLIFMSRERGAYYAFSVHAWEPFPQTVATLRTVVQSVTRAAN